MWGCVILLRLKCTSHIVNTPPLPSPGYVIENQTLLSIRRAAKGKCVCFPLAQCFPSVFHFLPRASCTAAINPLLVVLYPLFFSFSFFFIANWAGCLAADWPRLSAEWRLMWQVPPRAKWTAVADEWLVSISITSGDADTGRRETSRKVATLFGALGDTDAPPTQAEKFKIKSLSFLMTETLFPLFIILYNWLDCFKLFDRGWGTIIGFLYNFYIYLSIQSEWCSELPIGFSMRKNIVGWI